MPYIMKQDRDRIANDGNIHSAGELNYQVTLLCLEYLKEKGHRYEHMNQVVEDITACVHRLASRTVLLDSTKLQVQIMELCEKYALGRRDYQGAVGALECCKLEMYRRLIGPYEDTAIGRNGDVY